ncbi:phosphatidate cytidylyltransferase [Paenibacillus koleovorans]|uniref:phosphatidate cytidylyltransferase n=1 Tax=Paenibacillus koleovorans TaxID=121608 RepID=UPI000FDC9C15|nr:phosphatidate cytidylyltransferase [Paenibacillus koleovorans]
MKQRVITGLLGGAIFLTFLLWGGVAYSALLLLMALVGLFEFNRMNRLKPVTIVSLLAYIGLILLVFPWGVYSEWLPNPTSIIWVTLFLLFAVTVVSKNKFHLDHIALSFIGVVYIGIGFQYMLTTRLADNGLYWAALVFACTILTDTGAYFTGKFFGRTKLWPSISPNKTVEGALGGIAVSILVGIGFSLYASDLLSIGQAVLIGASVAVVGQMGDLIQSAYKRIRGVKDTGSIFPGHGGVLDRVDSWLIVFPFVHLLSLLPQ